MMNMKRRPLLVTAGLAAALFLAMAMNVPLIKVSEGTTPEAPIDRATDASVIGRLRD